MEGYSSKGLSRRLGLFSMTSIVVANMIGAGIFTTSGLLMGQLGSPKLMIILWLLGGVMALCGALSYGELGASMPHAGGEYVYLSRLYHPLIGFLSGWVSFIVGFSAPIAASAIGFSSYFFRAFPDLETFTYLPNSFLEKVLAILIIVIFSGIHLRGISLGAKVQNFLTLIKIGLIIGLVGLGFIVGNGDFAHFKMQTDLLNSDVDWKTSGLALMWIMFAYSGWNASGYIGSEVRHPKKNLPRSLLLGTAIVMVLYFLLNILFVYAVTPINMEGVIAIGGLAAANLFGPRADMWISLMISFALFSSLSAFIILGPRVYYAMAKDGYFFKVLAHVHPVFKVPSKSIIIQALLAIVIVLSGSFEQILTYMGFALGIFPILAVMGVFILRKSGKSVINLPGYPWIQAFYIICGISILILAFLERPEESAIALLTVAIGIPIFFLFKKSNRKI